ncbi:hypothetical protein RRG08_044478 [Elysia crispata]|uniref:Uncharacterized protein n=1 Tax=Elysia crispata TaxID=231223 RepID=A0AAE0YZG5_9GAST|nr:hypothetical protein RRG08_044478 [Elysia crispata]
MSQYLSRQISKRQHHDPWNLCPREMTSVDCFYVYLRVYARLRQDGRAMDPDRMVGKRSPGTSFRSVASSSGASTGRTHQPEAGVVDLLLVLGPDLSTS